MSNNSSIPDSINTTFDVNGENHLSEMQGKYLTFWTDNQLYGVPICDVVQIVGIQEITQIPEFPAYAKGIIKLRESIIPVVDVRLRFHKEEVPYDERTCIIVTNINELNVGFIVDAVDEVADISDEQISPPPKVSNEVSINNAYLTGIGKVSTGVVLLLDTNKILNEGDIDVFSVD